MPLALLLSPVGILSMVLIAVGLFAGLQTMRLSSCKAESAETRAELTVAGDRLAQQNLAVSEWQAEAAKARQKGAAEAKKAKAVTQSHAKLVAALKARRDAPAPVVAGVELGCREGLAEVRAGK